METSNNYIFHFTFILTNHILKFLNVGFIQNVRISFYNILVYLSAIYCERGKLNFKADRNLVKILKTGFWQNGLGFKEAGRGRGSGGMLSEGLDDFARQEAAPEK